MCRDNYPQQFKCTRHSQNRTYFSASPHYCCMPKHCKFISLRRALFKRVLLKRSNPRTSTHKSYKFTYSAINFFGHRNNCCLLFTPVSLLFMKKHKNPASSCKARKRRLRKLSYIYSNISSYYRGGTTSIRFLTLFATSIYFTTDT
jgi:hypothetical protein